MGCGVVPGNVYAFSGWHYGPHSSSIKESILNWHDRLLKAKCRTDGSCSDVGSGADRADVASVNRPKNFEHQTSFWDALPGPVSMEMPSTTARGLIHGIDDVKEACVSLGRG